MWRNFRCVHMTDVEKSEILHIWHVCDVENVAKCSISFAIYAVLLLNLLFILFCREISCGEKFSPKVHLWRNMRSEGRVRLPNRMNFQKGSKRQLTLTLSPSERSLSLKIILSGLAIIPPCKYAKPFIIKNCNIFFRN